ncbi:tetratricopeptide repeat protein [Rubinisphaera sp.]|uniref:tetratricopeptide repeat protein n=1 Tax=Rubinisphaera sp. TaxID=2024857 RepID=UPI000C11C4E3|nr:tetratricopeptide repeat protein [Rubinisphaera sp.]MBV11761.1 hypothetical protein [Rubinisphaera sp.]HCS54470.1 hypothetical protein [Planctomycetaceae bacterium]
MNNYFNPQRPLWLLPKSCALGLMMCCAVGCQTFGGSGKGLSSLNPFGSPSDATASIDDIKGPMERTILASNSQSIVSTASLANTPEFQEYQAAKALYDAGNFAAAEKAFDKIAEDYALDDTGQYRRRTLGNFYKAPSERKAKYSDGPLREDALFMLAESRYKQEKYPGAEDVYLGLLKDYPNTRHLEASSKRLYDIALTWMDFKQTTNGEVQMAGYEENGRSGRPKIVANEEYNRPGFFNFFDKKRPTTDTEGRALEALKAIWLNDPTGPLADDALMLTASHYLRIGSHAEAAETYQLLREEFPDSPHAKDAYILGSYVTQASYQGAAYDEKNLEQSRQLKSIALASFQDLTPEERERLETELKEVEETKIAREFENALFWLGKGNFTAVEMVCHQIINTHPSSFYAGKARGLLSKLPEYQKRNTLMLAMEGVTVADIPSIDATQTAMVPEYQPNPAPAKTESPTSEPEVEEEKKPRFFPSWGMPKLRPVPKDPEEDEGSNAPPFIPNPGYDEAQPGKATLTLGQEPATTR